jgi:hypothetical protein
MGKFVLWSGPTNVKEYPEEDTQSFLAGDLLKFDASSGEIEIASNGDDVAGVAIDGASGVTGTQIKMHVVTPLQVWSVETTGTPAVADVSEKFDVATFTAGNMVVDVGSGGSDLIIDDLDPRDTAASGSRVLVHFVSASCSMWE